MGARVGDRRAIDDSLTGTDRIISGAFKEGALKQKFIIMCVGLQ